MPGPVPKRVDQRHGHRTQAEKDTVEQAPAGQAVEWPEPDERWHAIARMFYEALQVSGQSQYYEQSDVATAFYVTEAMHRSLQRATGMNGQLLSTVLSGAGSLLATEGDRRRLRLELARADAGPTEAELSATSDLDAYRARLSG